MVLALKASPHYVNLFRFFAFKSAARAMGHSTLRQLGPLQAGNSQPGRTDTLFLNDNQRAQENAVAYDIIRSHYGAYQ